MTTVNTLTAQLVGIARVPLYEWGSPAGGNGLSVTSFGPAITSTPSEGANGNLYSASWEMPLAAGGEMTAVLAASGQNIGTGNMLAWSYFDDMIWVPNAGGGASGIPNAHASYRFKLPPPKPFGTTPTIRGRVGVNVNNAASVTVNFPAAARVGDLCVITTAHGYNVVTPTGWTQLDNQSGSQLNGAAFSKVLTSADITAGNVTITYGGSYYGIAVCTVVAGNPGVTHSSFSRQTFGGTPQTINAQAAGTDLVLFFAAMRGPFTSQPVTESNTTNELTITNGNVNGVGSTSSGVGNPTDTILTGGGTTGGWGSYVGYVTIGSGVGPAVTLVNRPQVALDTVFQTNKGSFTPYFPFMWQGRRAGATWFNGQNPGASVDVWLTNTNDFIVHALDLSQIGFLATYNVAMNRLIPGAAALSNIAQYDNVIVRFPGASGVGPAPIAPPSVTYINSLSGAQATLALHLDNPTLDAIFQAAAEPVNYSIFPWGFIYPMPITTAGNKGPLTGQTREVLVFNTDFTQYYVIQFVPQDNSQSLLTNTDFFDFRWTVNIDQDGIVWFSPGYGSTLTTSYSAIGLDFPAIQAPPLNPFDLPCYNVCSPVDFLDITG